MMKRLMSITLIMVLIGAFAIGFTACSKNGSGSSASESSSSAIDGTDAEDYDNGITFEEEDEDADLTFEKKSTDDYLGKWTATSGQAAYEFGNIDLNIKSGGKWSGNVADGDLSGTWEESSDGISLTSELFNCELSFTDEGVLVLRYMPDGDDTYLNAVLTKE